MRSTTASREDWTLFDMRENVSAGITEVEKLRVSGMILEKCFLDKEICRARFSLFSVGRWCIARAWLNHIGRKSGMMDHAREYGGYMGWDGGCSALPKLLLPAPAWQVSLKKNRFRFDSENRL